MTINQGKKQWTVLLFGLLGLFLLSACGSSEVKQKPTEIDVSVPRDVNMLVGIGKVEPQIGMIELASELGGIVKTIDIEVGDTVKKGQILAVLEHRNESLQISQLQAEIATQRLQVKTKETAVEKFQTQVAHKTQSLEISRSLAEEDADTRQHVSTLEKELKVLQARLKESKQAVEVSRAEVEQLQVQLSKAQLNLKKKNLTAPIDGVILSKNIKIGEAMKPLQAYATLAPLGPYIVHGEADQMFADRLKKGQNVTIHFIGDSHIITTGKISSLAPLLSNKSMFTGRPGEEQDRRVRRFKVLLDSTGGLLINTKVECNISLD